MMGNEKRLMILCQLGQGEKSVGELESLIGLKQSAMSQHLAKLRAQKLVQTRRESQTIFYSLASKEVEQIISALYGLYCPNLNDKG
jgi:DNA-binding transcriptional ArsR family regulator